jgi:Protein of unknown function (DUF2786)
MAENQDKLDLIRKLLAKAERAGSVEEADAFSAKAQELMLRYAIDEAILGQRPESGDKVNTRTFTVRFYPKQKSLLLAGIASAFGCQTVRFTGRGNSSELKVQVTGWVSDLDLVDILYASLDIQANREAERRWLHTGHMVGTPRRTFTGSFFLGFATTVADRLAKQHQSAVQEAEDTAPGTGLVLLDRKKAVSREFTREHPRTKTDSMTVGSHAGYNSGKAAGNLADLGTGSRLGARGPLAVGR